MATTIVDVEQFWDRQPCNIRHSNHPVGTLSYFEQVSQRKFLAEPHLLTFTDFPSWSNKKVLEIGCGIGTAAINFIRYGADYTGVDLSKNSIELCSKSLEVYDYRGSLYHGNAEKLDEFLPFCKFDLIYSWGVLHHTPRPDLIINQIKKYLAPTGTLKIMVYARNSWKNFMIESGLDQPESQWGCPIANTYDKEDVRRMLGDDFEVINLDQDHIFPYEIEAYKKKEYVLQPWFRSMPKEMFHVLEKYLGWHLMITAKFRKNS
jgi:SAM-dependent methyltransferase